MCTVGKADEMGELDARPVCHGIKDTKDQRDDNRYSECKEQREQEDHVDDLSVVRQCRKQIESEEERDYADYKERSPEGSLIAHEIERERGDSHDCACDHQDQG